MSLRHRRYLLAPLGVLLATAALARVDNFQRVTTLGPQETLTQANEYMTKIRSTEARVSLLKEQAQKKKDVIKFTCVNDKLIRVRVHLSVADQSMAGLNSALARSDAGGRQHEFTRVTILYEKVLVLGTEAENCIGEDASYVGKTTVDVEIDPNIPDDDPTNPQLPLPDVTRPPEASPFV
jgi:hypothetical protein